MKLTPAPQKCARGNNADLPMWVLGDANADVAVRVARFPREGEDVAQEGLGWSSGGAGVNVATMFAQLGGKVHLLSRVGTDTEAALALRAAQTAGVNLTGVERDSTHRTGTCVVLVSPSGERTFLSFRGANQHYSFSPAISPFPNHLHVCGHALLEGTQRTTALSLVDRCAKSNITVSLDLCLPLIETHASSLLPLLPKFQVVFANEVECAALADRVSPPVVFTPPPTPTEAVPSVFSPGPALFVLKRGARGCSVFQRGAPRIDVEPFTVVAADTTAAGDAFVAAFLFAHLQNYKLYSCGRFANAAGAVTAQSKGSGANLPTLTEVQQLYPLNGQRS
ncbi:MAG: carbohydrate kinase family protein [Polyangiaceae bacterium]|nr:carbohydrate kinase family protein [Polyangiaceae bacterium]